MDIGFFIKNGIEIDVEIEDGDLKIDNGLETAILISIFTDKRVTKEEAPGAESSLRGWWGDLVPDVDQDQIGSKLWTLDRSKQIDSNIPKFENAINKSLDWMIEDGIAENIETVVTYPERGLTCFEISVTRPGENESRFSFVWDGQELKGK